MSGTMIDITTADGGQFQAYFTKPKNNSGPGLILLQDIFGINAYLRDVADNFAE